MGWGIKDIVGAVSTGGLSLLKKPVGNAIKTISGAGAAKDASEILQGQAAEGAKAYAPYKQAGDLALGRISDIMSGKTKVNLSDIPGYTAGLEAGTSAISREAAAQGSRGGGTLASLFGFGQQYAGKAFGDYMSQLSGLANMGATATGAQVNLQQQGAQAQASGILGQQQAYTNLFSTGLNMAGAASGVPGLGSITSMFGSKGANPLSSGVNSFGGATGGQDNFYSWG